MLSGLEEKARRNHRASQQKRVSKTGKLKRRFGFLSSKGSGIRLRRKLTGRKDQTMKTIPAGDLALDTGTAADRGPLYFSDRTIAVYTALFGGYDDVMEPLITPDNIRYFIITDQDIPHNSKWEQIKPEDVLPESVRGDDIMSNRWCKMHPHLLFPDFDTSVYCDANLLITSDMTPVTAGLDNYPVAMFRHKRRDCVYDEVDACLLQRKAPKGDLKRHLKRLRSAGIPQHWGLLEAPVIARRHRDPLCIELMDAWWDLFTSGSRRDQLSLIETLWQRKIPPETIGTLGADVSRCRLFIMNAHK